YTEQADFINTAVVGQTDLAPADLLRAIKDIEHQVGRIPTFRNGPREIDIDIIFYDDLVMKTKELTIPHPELSNRDFVLQPLADLDSNLRHPVSKQTVIQLLAALEPSQKSILKALTEKA